MEQTITAKKIHEDFRGAEERLYVEAIGLSQGVLTSINDKSKRLQKLGFGKSKTVKDCEQKEAKRKVSGRMIHVIEYFRTHYPMYKFITEEEVKRLCEKYGLLLGETGNYIGDVPEKNLREIENFKLRKEDWKEKTSMFSDWGMVIPQLSRDLDSPRGIMSYLADESPNLYFSRPRQFSREYEEYKYQLELQKHQYLVGYDPFKSETKRKVEEKKEYEQPPFKICAPKQDFQTSGWEVRDGYKLVYDPIVLQPVSKEGIEGYLIVTAWGDEASDENVVNEIKN